MDCPGARAARRRAAPHRAVVRLGRSGYGDSVTLGADTGAGSDYAALADRDAVLAALTRLIANAWHSFERPRPTEPAIDAGLLDRLAQPLPEAATDPSAVLADAARDPGSACSRATRSAVRFEVIPPLVNAPSRHG